MYFIKKIVLDDKQNYRSSEIMDHTSKTIGAALILLENTARTFVREECGREAAEKVKILDIHKMEQVSEPLVDCMLLYRLAEDPHRIHVYQRKTDISKAKTWGGSEYDVATVKFRRMYIIELEKYEKLDLTSLQNTNLASIIPQVEMVSLGPAGIKVPKPMTVAPMCHLIDELKKSAKFKKQFTSVSNCPAPLSAPDIKGTRLVKQTKGSPEPKTTVIEKKTEKISDTNTEIIASIPVSETKTLDDPNNNNNEAEMISASTCVSVNSDAIIIDQYVGTETQQSN